jgi:hypothetical protein
VRVQSTPGHGATFTLRLPVHVPPPAALAWEAAMHADGAVEDGVPSASTEPAPARAAALGGGGSKRPRSPSDVLSPPRLRCLLVDDHEVRAALNAGGG